MLLFNYKYFLKTTPMTVLKSKLKESYILVISTLAVVLILSLSAFSIHIFIRKQNISSKVLGTTFSKKEKDFWIEYLAEHPFYYPGWVEKAQRD
jgi:hypothetical protein